MAIYTVRKDYVDVIGRLWMPATVAASRIALSSYDLGNMLEDEDDPTRDEIEAWLATHSGDFSEILDFAASIGTKEIPWADEESELTWADCMYPSED
jgi:hypothetical protein